MSENKEVKKTNKVEQVAAPIQEQLKELNPVTDVSDYFVQIRNKDGQVIKTLIANNSTVTIGVVGNQSIISELK